MVPAIRQLLAELVRRPSVNPMGRTDLPAEILFEHRVTDYLEGLLRGLGVAVERQAVAPGRANLIAHYEPPTPSRVHFLWEAHQDTVPIDGMVIDPFGGTVADGKLSGRGACDIKAGITCMVTAFARLVQEKPLGSAAITVAFTVDEEHTFLGIQHLMASGFRADGAIVAEPTLLDVVTAHKGVVRWTVETTGRACHSSRPSDGVNAIYRMAKLVAALETYAAELMHRPGHELLGPRTLSVGRIAGGASPNTIPDFCRIDVDRRLLPGETAVIARADLEAFLRSWPGVDFSVVVEESHKACPPLGATLSGELTRRLGSAIDRVVGGHAIRAVPFGTDASTVAEAGVPAVVFGPGDIAQAHTRDEWIELSQVEAAAEVLYQFATRLE